MRRLASFVAFALLCAAAPRAHATVFYSIDITNDQLVTIDNTTGVVTTVGAIGYNFGGASLAYFNGYLYATNLPLCVTSFVDLVKIDPLTGAKVSQVRVKVGATDLQTSAADGLTANASTLLLSYRASTGACGQAHVLADLSTSGAVTNQTDFYPVAAGNSDMDNIAYDPATDRLFANDGVGGASSNTMNFYVMARPSAYSLVGAYTTPVNDGDSGMVFTSSGALWVYQRVANQVRQIDTTNGHVVQSVTLTSARTLRGLAVGQNPTPVTPSTWGARACACTPGDHPGEPGASPHVSPLATQLHYCLLARFRA